MISKRSMKLINVLFFLAVFLRFPPLTILTYGIWLLFLLYARKRTDSKGVRTVYGVLAAYALVTIACNLYFLFVG